MKKKAFLFLAIAALALSIVPALNLAAGAGPSLAQAWWTRQYLYSLDVVLPYLNRVFYRFGVSLRPEQVIIGKNSWLYLGDDYAESISVKRRGVSDADREVSKKIGLATRSWEKWLKLHGVDVYRIMIGPDKDTIYPEFLPSWAKSSPNSVTSSFLENVGSHLYVDVRSQLASAKSRFSMPLYYQTDTHWNALGAWVAFQAFWQQMDGDHRKLKGLTARQVQVAGMAARQGGDLARFLKLSDFLSDTEISMALDNELAINVAQFDYETGNLLVSGGNPQIGVPQKPLLVRSEGALNKKRVLWLRDSFGTALSPFMAAAFSEVVQVNYLTVDANKFAHLVNTYKPDYVFVTVVERNSRSTWFQNLPPISVQSGVPDHYVSHPGRLHRLQALPAVHGA